MNNLDKAREWAKVNIDGGYFYHGDRALDAAKIIQSLPDQWVDVEKVREIIEEMDDCLNAKSTTDFSKGIDNATTSWRDALKALITPKLPTLADMTQEEREACQFMQARFNGNASDFVISEPGRMESRLWAKGGTTHIVDNRLITPLPDLPKLEWPGGVTDCEIVEEPETVDAPPAEKAELPKPEDVPPNEPWLIEVDDRKAIGTRYKGDAHAPWAVAALDGGFAEDYLDYEITLIHKLVPEPPALPEGMRVADHEEFGRVVVSPETDQDDDYLAFYSDKNIEYGGSWTYPKEYELTFLDGGN